MRVYIFWRAKLCTATRIVAVSPNHYKTIYKVHFGTKELALLVPCSMNYSFSYCHHLRRSRKLYRVAYKHITFAYIIDYIYGAVYGIARRRNLSAEVHFRVTLRVSVCVEKCTIHIGDCTSSSTMQFRVQFGKQVCIVSPESHTPKPISQLFTSSEAADSVGKIPLEWHQADYDY